MDCPTSTPAKPHKYIRELNPEQSSLVGNLNGFALVFGLKRSHRPHHWTACPKSVAEERVSIPTLPWRCKVRMWTFVHMSEKVNGDEARLHRRGTRNRAACHFGSREK